MAQVTAQVAAAGRQVMVKLLRDANNNSAGCSLGASVASYAFIFGGSFRRSSQWKVEVSGNSRSVCLMAADGVVRRAHSHATFSVSPRVFRAPMPVGAYVSIIGSHLTMTGPSAEESPNLEFQYGAAAQRTVK